MDNGALSYHYILQELFIDGALDLLLDLILKWEKLILKDQELAKVQIYS